mmetsp:Transcript_4126/g.15952  ORF Transcript_4126/g.15952 Transcript_4126/m.15952 type:complete len:307 (+) Transcript_4126:683-1603(+)
MRLLPRAVLRHLGALRSPPPRARELPDMPARAAAQVLHRHGSSDCPFPPGALRVHALPPRGSDVGQRVGPCCRRGSLRHGRGSGCALHVGASRLRASRASHRYTLLARTGRYGGARRRWPTARSLVADGAGLGHDRGLPNTICCRRRSTASLSSRATPVTRRDADQSSNASTRASSAGASNESQGSSTISTGSFSSVERWIVHSGRAPAASAELSSESTEAATCASASRRGGTGGGFRCRAPSCRAERPAGRSIGHRPAWVGLGSIGARSARERCSHAVHRGASEAHFHGSSAPLGADQPPRCRRG